MLRHTFYGPARFAAIALLGRRRSAGRQRQSVGFIARRVTVILFIPMVLVLLIVILFPDLMLWLPRKLMPAYVK